MPPEDGSIAAPRPALLACYDSGVRVVELSAGKMFGRGTAGPAATAVSWDERPAATVKDGPLPSIELRWASGKFTLRRCVGGDIDEFRRALGYGPAGRVVLR